MAESGIDLVTRYLGEQGVSYEVVEHRASFTAAEEARAAGIPAQDVAKTVVLRHQEGYSLAVIPASERLDLEKVRELLGAERSLRLATEEEMEAEFEDFEVGALPPLGPLFPATEVIDRRLLDHERILFSGGDHRHGILIDPNDLVEVAQPKVADVCEE